MIWIHNDNISFRYIASFPSSLVVLLSSLFSYSCLLVRESSWPNINIKRGNYGYKNQSSVLSRKRCSKDGCIGGGGGCWLTGFQRHRHPTPRKCAKLKEESTTINIVYYCKYNLKYNNVNCRDCKIVYRSVSVAINKFLWFHGLIKVINQFEFICLHYKYVLLQDSVIDV